VCVYSIYNNTYYLCLSCYSKLTLSFIYCYSIIFISHGTFINIRSRNFFFFGL
jgi:hypothetical protein